MLEDGTPKCSEMMTNLLKHLFSTAIITPDQFKQGFQRIFSSMSDIVLDVPLAYTTLSGFIEKSVQAGYLTQEIAKEMPQR